MRNEPISGMRWLGLLVALWLALMLVVASPAWAHDDDDDDDGPPPVTTTTTIPPTTTTIAATTTTTIPAPRDDQWEEQRLESWFGATTTTTSNPEPPAGSESKDSLVLSIALPGGSNGGGGQSGDGGFHISPREGLTVAFRTAVETIKGQLLLAIVLGILIAALTVVGVDKRRVESQTGASSSNPYPTDREPLGRSKRPHLR